MPLNEMLESDNNQPQEAERAQILAPFDPKRLRLSQDLSATLGVKKAIITIPVRKPSRETWVRVHPAEAYRIQTGILELKEEREIDLVAPELWSTLASEATFSARVLFTAITRQGVLFLWPIRLPGQGGKVDSWNRSALEAAMLSINRWVRIAANMNLGAYDVFEATGTIPDPEWPDILLRDILQIAFKDYLIDDFNHPVLRRLRGEL
jgi:hypothetical protein